MKRLRVYAGVPREYAPTQKSAFADAKATLSSVPNTERAKVLRDCKNYGLELE